MSTARIHASSMSHQSIKIHLELLHPHLPFTSERRSTLWSTISLISQVAKQHLNPVPVSTVAC
uniref:Uncharacterized protein n=1 Tax=Arundo donax TaxID=35708 RepID=A0A0A9FPQ9_ARUDO